MALDHYVSQVYLRNFYAGDLGNRLYAVSKDNLKEFTPRSRDVCRIEENNTNLYLADPRAVEEFLKLIEPQFNRALKNIENNNIDNETIFVVAGFIVFIMTCSPTATRLKTVPLQALVETQAQILDRNKMIPPPPNGVFGDRSLSDLLKDGTIKVEIKQKYPQAMAIDNILRIVQSIGNFKWDIIENDSTYSPFMTSDYPVTLEETDDNRVMNKLVPLSPHLAVRIYPQLDQVSQPESDYSFSQFSYRRVSARPQEVRRINSNIVRCAEKMIFSSINGPWIKKFIKKHRGFMIDAITDRIPSNDGVYIIVRERVVRISE